jgi:phosphopantothenate---cysteine ligase (ATP)
LLFPAQLLTPIFGQISAEYFLENGYAVIFLHRESSLTPFARHWSLPGTFVLDFLKEGPNGTVMVNSQYQEKTLRVLQRYTAVKDRLLLLSFKTITDYLHEL